MRNGRQPCESYEPHLEGNAYGIWPNLHECYGPFREQAEGTCRGTVSWCRACGCDHHSGPKGWDGCPE